MSKPELSVLIVAWNGGELLERCVASVLASEDTPRLEVVIFDNASVDGSVDAAEQRFPDVVIHRNAENIGHRGGFNRGIRLVGADLILLLDMDTELAPDALKVLYEFIRERADVDMCAPRLFNADGTVQESARRLPNAWSGLFGRQTLITRLFPNNRFSRRYLMADQHEREDPYSVTALSSAAMLFRRSLIDEVGAWDDDYPGYWVDMDWCMRLHRAGKRLFCVPRSRMVHHDNFHHRKRQSPRRVWIFHYGAWLLYRKHYTYGVLDPRSLLAFAALGARGCVLLALNFIQPSADEEETVDPSTVVEERRR